MTFTLLLTSAGGGLSPQVIRYLRESRRHHVRVVAVDARADASGRYFADAYATVPPGGHPDYVPTIVSIADRQDVDLILPCSDEEALALAAKRNAVETGGRQLACAPFKMLQRMSDKNQAFAFLREAGLPTPDWRCAGTTADLDDAIDDFAARGEFALKPARSRGNRGIYVIRQDLRGVHPTPSGRELHMDLATFRAEYLDRARVALPSIVAERLLPPAYDVDVLSWQGEALRIVPRRRFNAEGVPFFGNEIVDSEAIRMLGRQIAGAARLSWLYDFDLMTHPQGHPVVLELNPRPSGSFAASVAAGVPLLDDLISLAKREPLPQLAPMKGRVEIVPFTALAVART